MAALTRILARAFPATPTEIDVLQQLALLCGAGLLVSLLLMTYGLDLSPVFSSTWCPPSRGSHPGFSSRLDPCHVAAAAHRNRFRQRHAIEYVGNHRPMALVATQGRQTARKS